MVIAGLKRKLCRDLLIHEDATEFGSVAVTSFSYPNGESINLYFADFGDGILSVSDEGATVSFLKNQGIELAPDRRATIKTMCESRDVEFVTPVLRRQFHIKDIGTACMALCEAIIAVGTIFYHTMTPQRSSLPKAVDRLLSMKVEPERGVERGWTDKRHDPKGAFPVDFHLNGIGKPRNIFAVTSGSKSIMVVAVVNFLKSHHTKAPTLAIVDKLAQLGSTDMNRLQITADEIVFGIDGQERKIVEFALGKA